MQLFKTLEDAKGFLEGLETDLDRIDCLDYLILELEERTKASDTKEDKPSSEDKKDKDQPTFTPSDSTNPAQNAFSNVLQMSKLTDNPFAQGGA